MAELILPKPPKLIRAERCEKCRFAEPIGVAGGQPDPRFFCHRNPPTLTSMLMPDAQGKPIISSTTAFPIVRDEEWCGAFDSKVKQ